VVTHQKCSFQPQFVTVYKL